MIMEEKLRNDTLVRHWSNNNKLILQVETGKLYSEAIDVIPCRYRYVESEQDIPSDEPEEMEGLEPEEESEENPEE